MRKLPTFSGRPFIKHVVYFSSSLVLASFAAFFSAAVIAFFLAFSASKCSNMGRKSHFSNSLIATPLVWVKQKDHGQHKTTQTRRIAS